MQIQTPGMNSMHPPHFCQSPIVKNQTEESPQHHGPRKHKETTRRQQIQTRREVDRCYVNTPKM